jgi:hypothetical protein
VDFSPPSPKDVFQGFIFILLVAIFGFQEEKWEDAKLSSHHVLNLCSKFEIVRKKVES